MKMAFIATSDAHGECDSSFRAGPPGFMRVLDEKTVMWPEYKGNGVMASMGNIVENPYVGHPDRRLLRDRRRPARQRQGDDRRERRRSRPSARSSTGSPFATAVAPSRRSVKKTPERWVVVSIDEAYVHCSKHIPMLAVTRSREAEAGRRAGDVFKAKNGDARVAAADAARSSSPTRQPAIGDGQVRRRRRRRRTPRPRPPTPAVQVGLRRAEAGRSGRSARRRP